MQVSMMAVRALVAAVDSADEGSGVLSKAGLSSSRLDDAGARISIGEYGRIVEAVLSASGDPALGLHMGERVTTGGFDVLGYLGEQSRSLREALQTCARYARIVSEGPRLELEEQGDGATIRLTLLRGESPLVRVSAEFVTISLLRLARRFAGRGAQPRRVLFGYEAPAHRAEYARLFGGREQFSQAFTGLEFERSWLDRTQSDRSAELYALLEARAELLLARLEQDAPVAERVKRWLASENTQQKPTMEAIARGLGMSERSLRRRLCEERARYNDLVEEARALRAKRMLADPRHTVQETAYAMGFGTPAAFSRAFKRWTGMAPSAYRASR